MSLRDDIPALVDRFKALNNDVIPHNEVLFNIYEGDLLSYIEEDMRRTLSKEFFEQIKDRIAPINVLGRVVDKLSKLYSKSPVRTLQVPGSKNAEAPQKDLDIFEFYKREFDIDTTMGLGNEFFNMFKNCLIEPFLDRGKPRLRMIPSHQFFVYSNDQVNPLRPTHIVKIMGKWKKPNGEEVTVLWAYTDDEFLIFDDKKEVVEALMQRPDVASLNGRNPYGKIPMVYVNRSRHMLTPKPDTDTLAMTKLIPLLLSDLNGATKFQCFSIVYGIDLDEKELKINPNAFWRLKSDPASQGKASIGTIKPEVDIEEVMNLIHTELSLWMNTKNIRPGSVGALKAENMTSGISKAIDEMDTSEDRQKQVPYFKQAEREFWDLVINHLHPNWMGSDGFELNMAFSPGAKVETQFAEQRPIVDESKLLDDVIKKIEASLETPEGALKTLYPDWTDAQVTAKVAEIETYRKKKADELAATQQVKTLPLNEKGSGQFGEAG
jgi:hypothetical protein